MLLKRFDDENLAQVSWLLGCPATGEALVVDPNRDVDAYVRAAQREGLRITHVTETHIHADFVSGALELAARTGARAYLSGEGGDDWKYAWAKAAGAILLHDGDTIPVGRIRVKVLHTPGHTPEHLAFVVTDGAVTDRPIGVFTGDFVFFGDVGRPDLLERAAGARGTMEASASVLYDSLDKFRALPDFLQVWPGHGAGSACGKSLGAVPQSTVGYEKATNWAFRGAERSAFVDDVLAGQPDPPRYFARRKRVNREGPPILGPRAPVARLVPEGLRAALEAGAIVVDVRPAAEFAIGHVPGVIEIPANRSFTTWAGWLLPEDRPIHLLAGAPELARVDELALDLTKIGIDRVAGAFGPEAIDAWKASGGTLESTPRIAAREAAELAARGAAVLLDVRERREWDAGHAEDAIHLSLGNLAEGAKSLDAARPLVVMCGGGTRSMIAASLLQRAGFPDVRDLEGGFGAWRADGLPSTREDPAWASSR